MTYPALFYQRPFGMISRAALLALALAACGLLRPNREMPSAQRYVADVTFLAADAQEGRGVATEGIRRAAEYIQRELQGAGLQPVFDGSYYQPFTASVGAFTGPGTFLEIDGKRLTDSEFRLFGLSSPGGFRAPMVFAGYGISAPEYGYDDYAGVDVKGKAVVLLRYEPQETSPTSLFDGTQWSDFANFRYKIFNARRHGASAVLLVTGPKVHEKQGDELVPMQSDPMAGAGFGIPMFHVARSAMEPILAKAGINLLQKQNEIDAHLKPQSEPLDLTATGLSDLQRKSFQVENVGAVLRGRDASRSVVIGAHYDHLGFGGPYAVSGAVNAIYHGADDNASGVAGLLALARWYGAGQQPPVNLIFVAFTAEESGLVGSTYYVQHAPYEMGGTMAMLNMDMIGRMRNNLLTVYGTRSAGEFESMLTDVTPAGLEVIRKPDGFGPSDHSPFYGSGVPVMHFFTGTHSEYHKPSDTTEKIDATGAVAVIDMVRAATDRIAAANRLTYLAPEKPATLYVGQDAGPTAGYLGILPDFASRGSGVAVASVKKQSPAEGNLQPGDEIVGFSGEPIANFYELTYYLRRKKPGEDAEILFRRGDILKRVKVRLGKRP